MNMSECQLLSSRLVAADILEGQNMWPHGGGDCKLAATGGLCLQEALFRQHSAKAVSAMQALVARSAYSDY